MPKASYRAHNRPYFCTVCGRIKRTLDFGRFNDSLPDHKIFHHCNKLMVKLTYEQATAITHLALEKR